MKRRDIALAAALLPFASIFAGSTAFAADAGNLKKLRVGVTAGPAAEILEQVVPLAKAKGLDIQIFEFQDYIQPNAALDSGHGADHQRPRLPPERRRQRVHAADGLLFEESEEFCRST